MERSGHFCRVCGQEYSSTQYIGREPCTRCGWRGVGMSVLSKIREALHDLECKNINPRSVYLGRMDYIDLIDECQKNMAVVSLDRNTHRREVFGYPVYVVDDDHHLGAS